MKKREEHKYPLNVLIDISDLDTPYLLDDELMGKLRMTGQKQP